MRALDPHDFFPTLMRTPGISLVVFVKPGCGACRATLAALERWQPRELALERFVVDGESGPGLVADYEIVHFPALFVWRDGDYHAAISAAPTPAAIERAIGEALARPPEPEP